MTRKTMATPRRAPVRLPGQFRADRILGLLGQMSNRTGSALRAHPRAAAAAGLLIAVGVIAGLLVSSDDEPVQTRVTTMELPGQSAPAQAKALDDTETPIDENTIPTDLPADPPPVLAGATDEPVSLNGMTDIHAWQMVEVRRGQTLERIFRDLGLSPRELHEVVNANEKTRQLARIRPGDEFAFDINEEGGFRALRTEFDEESWLFVERGENGLDVRTEPRALERRVVEANGTITTSLYRAAGEAGLSDNLTMRLANIFGWDIDFALEIRAGDRFALIYQEIWRDGQYLRDGPILAARFVNQGESFQALRYDAGNGPDYFAPDGRPMRKAFLRAPLNFSRVTSNFNPRRFHPITRQVRPHNGTDYGAPTGTPVWAAGDGRVIRSAYNNRNGHYVFIQHGNNFETRYLHLSQRQAKVGDRVRQGQAIGRVGATGMATGPHLHYEFLANGVHRNPRTVDLPAADPLPSEHRESFDRLGKQLLAELDRIDQPHRMLAQAEESCDQSASSC